MLRHEITHGAANMTETAANAAPVKKLGLKPSKILPTDRIAFPKQLDLLRAYAAASEPSGRPVSNDEVSKITKLTPSTVSLGNAFAASVGFIRKAEGGYVPSAEVVAFGRAYQWDPATASYKLAPAIEATWFAQAILSTLRMRAMEDREAVTAIAEAAAAGPGHKSQIEVCLDYMESAGIITREGRQITLRRTAGAPTRDEDGATAPSAREPKESQPRATASATGFGPTTEGMIQFDVNVRVRMSEMSGWSADRISAFFAGVAQVLAAKGQTDDGND
jgi:hypothetical protein